MKELSVFIDGSGDFGEITERPAYYIVTLLFHDQKNEIASNVKKLEDMLNFIVGSPITYEMAVVNRKDAPNKISLSGRLGREISNVIVKHKVFLSRNL